MGTKLRETLELACSSRGVSFEFPKDGVIEDASLYYRCVRLLREGFVDCFQARPNWIIFLGTSKGARALGRPFRVPAFAVLPGDTLVEADDQAYNERVLRVHVSRDARVDVYLELGDRVRFDGAAGVLITRDPAPEEVLNGL